MLADCIMAERAATRSIPQKLTLDQLAIRLGQKLALENDRFDHARFLKACGVMT